MSDMQRENARLARKRRKEQLEIKRGTKRTRIVDETDKVINARIARMKRKEKLQQLREAKRARQNNSEPSQQTSIQASSSSTPSTIVHSQIWNFGKPTYICQHCNALLWYEERLNSNKSTTNPSFGMCCKQGKIKLPPLKEPPQYLKRLLTGEGKIRLTFEKTSGLITQCLHSHLWEELWTKR